MLKTCWWFSVSIRITPKVTPQIHMALCDLSICHLPHHITSVQLPETPWGPSRSPRGAPASGLCLCGSLTSNVFSSVTQTSYFLWVLLKSHLHSQPSWNLNSTPKHPTPLSLLYYCPQTSLLCNIPICISCKNHSSHWDIYYTRLEIFVLFAAVSLAHRMVFISTNIYWMNSRSSLTVLCLNTIAKSGIIKIKCWWVSEQNDLSYMAGENLKWHSHSGRVWQFLIKLNMQLPYDPTIVASGIYPWEWKLMFSQKTMHKYP